MQIFVLKGSIPAMIDVFVSYSRRDLTFVQRLNADLGHLGKNVWFDQKKEALLGLAPTVKWWDEIKHGIETADNFLIVISPESMKSPYCHAEIAQAIRNEKRIVPLIYCQNGSQVETFKAIDIAIDNIPPDPIPDSVSADISNFRSLARRNWRELTQYQFLPYINDTDWNQWLRTVVDAVDLDIQWIRMWTQFRQAVQIWVESDYDQYEMWSERRLKPLREAIAKRKQDLSEDQENFLLPEQERLLRELETLPKDATSHERRRDIGDRLAVIDDMRKGVGVVDGLPDVEWIPVTGSDGNFEFEFDIPDFYISKYLVTYAQYQVFADSDYDNPQWWQGFPKRYQPQKLGKQRTKIANAPRDTISWYQSVAFSRWLDARYRELGLFERLLSLKPSPQTPLPTASLGEGLKDSYRQRASIAMVNIARDLRQRQTPAEVIMWECLRNRRLANIKFRRQHPVANTNYVVDFFSYEHKLVIELDGGIHATQQDADAQRQSALEVLGLQVIRFTNEQVYTQLQDVLATIIHVIESPASFSDLSGNSTNSPLPQSELGEGLGVRANNWQIRLPTEQEWQRVAQNGIKANKYPWGNWKEGYANTSEAGLSRTTAVGMYPHGQTICGAMDMSGNLREWCLNDYDNPEVINGFGNAQQKVLHGGSFAANHEYARASYRNNGNPRNDHHGNGLRLVVAPISHV